MKPFYFSVNNSGYLRVHFVDPVTGKRLPGKSTHTKDKVEATLIAAQWLKDGVPCQRANSRAFESVLRPSESKFQPDLKSFVNRLSDNDIAELVRLLSEKLGKPVINHEEHQENKVPVSNLPSSAPKIKQAPVKVIVRKKAPSESPKLPDKLQEDNGLCKFLEDFWDFDNSRFLKEQIALGKHVTQKHCKEMYQNVARHWRPYFGDTITASELNSEKLMDFFFYLNFEKGLAGATVNKAINCGKRAVEYMYKKGLISENPFVGVERFAANGMERGIPTESEVRELMNLSWDNPVSKLAFNLSAFIGLRAGEISGLQVCDIDLDAELLHLRHSWNVVDKLKGLKNGESRPVPCDRQTLMALLRQAEKNPLYSDTSFIFWSNAKPEQPYHPNYYEEGFYDALTEIGISNRQRLERNIVFHSLRHFCATLLRQRADLATVQELLGHKSDIMTKHYSDHESKTKFAIMRKALEESKDFILKRA